MDDRPPLISPVRLRVDHANAEYYLMPTPPLRTCGNSDTGKQVVYEPSKEVYADTRYDGIEVSPYQHISSDASSEKQLLGNDTRAARWSRKKKMVLLWTGGILVVLIIIVIATVLATTLPKKNGEEKSTDDAQSDEKGKESEMVSRSSLAATAWVVDELSETYALRLIHQNADGQLQSSIFNSASGNWSEVNNFMTAASGSPLALSGFNKSIYNSQDLNMQHELFFLDVKGKGELREWNWDTSAPSLSGAGAGGVATSHDFQAHPSSQIGSYWPFIIFQGPDGDLLELVYGPQRWDISPRKTDDWTIPVLEGGAIQIVPVQQALTKMGVFYQQEDLTMVLYERDGDNKNGREGVYVKDANFTTPPLPPKAALAAFSLPGDDEEAYSPLKTYALYQDSDAKIQMLWRNDTSSGWRGPETFSAFESADNGTSIGCVTMYSFLGQSMEKLSVPGCFFMAGGNITQVKMVNEDWEVVGIVGVNEH